METSAGREPALPSPPLAVAFPSVRHSRLWWLVAIFMAATVVLAAVDVPKRAPPTPIAAADEVILRPPSMGFLYQLSLSKVPKGQGVLLGPHFVLIIEGVAAVPKIDATQARALGLPSPLRATEGHELLFVDLATRLDVLPRFSKSGIDLSVAVVVGGVPRPLDGQVVNGRLMIISVPTGGPIALVVTDEGRGLTMNLRDGFVGPESAYEVRVSESLREVKYAGTGTIRAATATRPLGFDVAFTDRAALDPFLGGLGWAGRGRAWLHLSGINAQADGYFGWDRRKGEFPASVTLDTSQTFKMKLPGGDIVRPRPGPPLSVDFGDPRGFSLVFNVPDSFSDGSLQITPQGTFTALFSDGKLPATLVQPPAAGEVPIIMQP